MTACPRREAPAGTRQSRRTARYAGWPLTAAISQLNMDISYSKSLLIGFILCLPVYLLGCHEQITQRAFDPPVWKTGDHRIRGQMAQDLINKKILVGKTRKQAINLLGQPDEDDKEFITYFIYFGDEFAPPPFVHIEFDKRQIIKDVWISD